MFKLGSATGCTYLGDIRIKRAYLGAQLIYPCGHCCTFNGCDYTILNKHDCEECEYEDPTCYLYLPQNEDGSCPAGFTQQYEMCARISTVANCSECSAAAAAYNAYDMCSPGARSAGACGFWVPGVSCVDPGKCSEGVCVTGLPEFYYGGTFKLGEHQNLSDPWGGYRGPHDSSGTFSVIPSCGVWKMQSDKWHADSSYYINQYLTDGCLGDIKNIQVRIYKNAPPTDQNAVLWQTVNVSFSAGNCP